MINKAREIALKALYKIEKEDAYSNIALNQVLKENKNIDERDVGLISELVYGTITWKLTLDEIIKKYSNIKLKKISVWILNILRMGIYQIIFLDKIPKSAAVNESVNLAKRYGHKSSSNFVNAILRKVSVNDYKELEEIKDDKERISKTTSMPMWIIEELLKQKDIKEVEEICKNSNLKPNTTIRINKLKTNKKELEEKLGKRKIKYLEGSLEDFFVLKKVKNIENIDLFKEGFFTVQDEGAGLIVDVLAPKEDECILDACSSPGGKTTYIAEKMKNKGKIEAWDIHEHRVKLVQNAAKRLGINIIQAKTQDATEFNQDLVGKFDKILLDVPCLGLGVIKRKPDIKWKRKKEDIEEITKIQKAILDNCSKYLKKNGELVYSTCSILKEENEDIIERFLKENLDFKICKENEKNYENIVIFGEKDKYINIYPSNENDGFFICKLRKM
ncbi:MAG: 16S rRNA (cytosine(967)-C(5))-methyltransferase RsmB [Clostridia bacterium]|nr:16S rRNA (cytosine(967)-C(5))-methyltransferase RsmB [Clostridium sp.]